MHAQTCLFRRSNFQKLDPLKISHYVFHLLAHLVMSCMHVYPTGKTPEEIRKTFNIKNDFTPEEEEQVCVVINLVPNFVYT